VDEESPEQTSNREYDKQKVEAQAVNASKSIDRPKLYPEAAFSKQDMDQQREDVKSINASEVKQPSLESPQMGF